MRIAFTICSNNYLSLARSLGKTLLQHNPEYTFIIGLVDKLDNSIAAYYKDYQIIPCDSIGLADIEDMAGRYSIAEFNTSVKPFYITYLFNRFPEAERVLFVDPDMLIYDKFTELDEGHQTHEILLTPHILHPVKDDGKNPDEASYLSTGTFNLGFLSVKRGPNTFAFMEWWCERLRNQCYFDFSKGLFVDQKWVNLVPIFFSSVKIIFHPGYNIAYWNIQERNIRKLEKGSYIVNDSFPLVIYHYSSVNIKEGKLFYKQQDRFKDEDFPLVKELFLLYRNLVLEQGYLESNKLRCYYLNFHDDYIRKKLKKTFGGRIKLMVKSLLSPKRRANLKKSFSTLLGD